MLLHVKIKPNQRMDKVELEQDGWMIRLKAPAVDGKANEHLIRYLSEVLAISRSSIVLKKGHTARFKTLEINCEEELVQNRLKAALEG